MSKIVNNIFKRRAYREKRKREEAQAAQDAKIRDGVEALTGIPAERQLELKNHCIKKYMESTRMYSQMEVVKDILAEAEWSEAEKVFSAVMVCNTMTADQVHLYYYNMQKMAESTGEVVKKKTSGIIGLNGEELKH